MKAISTKQDYQGFNKAVEAQTEEMREKYPKEFKANGIRTCANVEGEAEIISDWIMPDNVREKLAYEVIA